MQPTTLAVGQVVGEPFFLLTPLAVLAFIGWVLLRRRDSAIWLLVMCAVGWVFLGLKTFPNQRERSNESATLANLRKADKLQKRIRNNKLYARQVRDNTVVERSQEADELNEQYAADVYPSAYSAGLHIAHQVAAILASEPTVEEDKDSILWLDSDSFNSVSESKSASSKFQAGFKTTLREAVKFHVKDNMLRPGHYMATSPSTENPFITIKGRPIEETPGMPDVNYLTAVVDLGEKQFEIHSGFATDGPWSDREDYVVFEYGSADDESNDACIKRAIEKLKPHIDKTLERVDTNLDYLADRRDEFLEAVTRDLWRNELHQNYATKLNGEQLSEPIQKLAQTFDCSPNVVRAVVANQWLQFTDKVLPEYQESEIDLLARRPHRNENAGIPIAVIGLCSVLASVQCVSRVFDRKN